ncbi:dephospho-CoA kinase [Mailhella sp.]|uniref:dephospho-CoA kinase n=1 Tax=Mailhella sp. TaxID=1981029 RepID=UPI003AB18246
MTDMRDPRETEELEFSDDDATPPSDEGEARRFTVPAGTKKMRLDAFLGSAAELSRSRVKKLVERGDCLVDGVCCSDADFRVRPGQTVELRMPGASEELAPEEGPLDVVYADDDIAVIDKPAGLTMHPCPSCPSGTLVHRLLARFPQLALQEGPRPGVVHRLDKDTSGLVIVALSERARLRLIEDFAARRVHKTYLAVTRGVPPLEGTSDLPIGRHPSIKTRMAVVPEDKGGRSALTKWRALYVSPSGRFALLAVRLFTGRTHQIRVHLAQAGFPLWGDAVYGPEDKTSPASRQLLHAWKLEFEHPVSGRAMRFVCPPPEDFPRAMLALEKKTRRVILTGMPGCGKSAVLARMEARGVPVWSADGAVASQYRPGADGWHLMRQRWGDAFFDDDGTVNRGKLTSLLASAPGMRRELERMIHPLVRGAMEAFFLRAQSCGAAVAVAEVPLWFETGWTCPGADIAVITCPDGIRHERLRATRNWSDAKIAAVESWQWKQEDKIAAADLLIRNDGTLEDLDEEVGAFLEVLSKRARNEEEKLCATWRRLWDGETSPS